MCALPIYFPTKRSVFGWSPLTHPLTRSRFSQVPINPQRTDPDAESRPVRPARSSANRARFLMSSPTAGRYDRVMTVEPRELSCNVVSDYYAHVQSETNSTAPGTDRFLRVDSYSEVKPQEVDSGRIRSLHRKGRKQWLETRENALGAGINGTKHSDKLRPTSATFGWANGRPEREGAVTSGHLAAFFRPPG